MRILLIVATHRYKYSYPAFLSITDFPAGIAYVASALKRAGHEVMGLNPNNDSSYPSAREMLQDKLQKAIRDFQPALIGLGGICIDYAFFKDAIALCRQYAPDTPIVCGGGIITNDAPFLFETLHPDFCVVGEGEEAMVRLAQALEQGGSLENIPNIGYWRGTEVVFTKSDFNYGPIDQLAFPDYDSFGVREMLDGYSMAARSLYRYPRTHPRPMTIVTARSCPFRCTFCVHHRGPQYRARSVGNIMEELRVAYEKYQFNVLIILDELFAVNKARMHEFCEALSEGRRQYGWDFDWSFQTHAVAALDVPTLKMAKAAGCYLFGYGVESASPRVLASMNKRSKPEQIAAGIEAAAAAEVGFGGNFIFGDPAETTETIKESMDFFWRYCRNININMISIQPYPGSKLFEVCRERGIIGDKLKFYETISEHIWNMTTIPDRLWFPWVHLLYLFSETAPWLKATDAVEFEVETDGEVDPIARYYGQRMCKISALCPHCGRKSTYRELLADAPAEPRPAQPRGHPLAGLKRLAGNRYQRMVLQAALVNAFRYLLTFRHPLFRTLQNLYGETKSNQNIVTCCKHCHLHIKIYTPKQDSKGKLVFHAKKLIARTLRWAR